jgi:hypothetical protein
MNTFRTSSSTQPNLSLLYTNSFKYSTVLNISSTMRNYKLYSQNAILTRITLIQTATLQVSCVLHIISRCCASLTSHLGRVCFQTAASSFNSSSSKDVQTVRAALPAEQQLQSEQATQCSVQVTRKPVDRVSCAGSLPPRCKTGSTMRYHPATAVLSFHISNPSVLNAHEKYS